MYCHIDYGRTATHTKNTILLFLFLIDDNSIHTKPVVVVFIFFNILCFTHSNSYKIWQVWLYEFLLILDIHKCKIQFHSCKRVGFWVTTRVTDCWVSILYTDARHLCRSSAFTSPSHTSFHTIGHWDAVHTKSGFTFATTSSVVLCASCSCIISWLAVVIVVSFANHDRSLQILHCFKSIFNKKYNIK